MAAKKQVTKRAFATGIKITMVGEDPCMDSVLFSLDEAKKQAGAEVLAGDDDECVVVYELVPLFVVTKKQTVQFAVAKGYAEA